MVEMAQDLSSIVREGVPFPDSITISGFPFKLLPNSSSERMANYSNADLPSGVLVSLNFEKGSPIVKVTAVPATNSLEDVDILELPAKIKSLAEDVISGHPV